MSEGPRARFRSRVGVAAERLKRLAFGRATSDGAERTSEQLGLTEEPRPDGCLIWLLCETAAEAGPAPAIATALQERLERPISCLVTPLDETPLVPSVKREVIHQFAPADSEGTVQRFLDHWTPDIAIVVGRPARPRLLSDAARRDIPLFYAAANRVTDAAPRRFPAHFRLFEKSLTSSASETNALRQQFARLKDRIETTGPLTDTVYALPCNATECDAIAASLGGRPVWLAAEVEANEIDLVETAHRKAFSSAHRLMLILVPKQVENTEEIARRFESQGWRVARRSAGDEPDSETQVYIADTEGELGLWYRISPASFIGGSTVPGVEPTDPFAAAALGSAVLHGTNRGTNSSRFDALAANGASIEVFDADDLGDAVITLLAPDKAASLAQAGWALTTESAHVVERLAEVIEETIYEREDAV